MASSPLPQGFDSEIHSVAVIGAGISGVTTAAHLVRQGLKVTLFERSNIAGGVWHYEPRISSDPDYPSEIPSHGDYSPSIPGQFSLGTPPRSRDDDFEKGSLETSFSPPGPCYAGLRNNVPTSLMVSSLDPWPEGTEENVSQDEIEKYIQMLAHNHKVDDLTLFNTRVDDIKKSPDGGSWMIRTVAIKNHTFGPNGLSPSLSEKTWNFDAVVVGTGHYNLPRVPDIPGLKEWKALFGDRVIHSKQYRGPTAYMDQNVLVIGAGVSSLDICREADGVVQTAYQSVRGGTWDLPATLLPPNAIRVGEVERFELSVENTNPGPLEHSTSIPGRVVLKNGESLNDIHQVILGTGYITSYPFLSQLHEDSTPLENAGTRTLVTSDGDMTHNLYKDIFYIEDPTLAFVGVPFHTATFSLFDFQAQAVARAFARISQLPNQGIMRKEYEKRVNEKGLGREFHSLRADGLEETYVRDLVEWANGSAEDTRVEPMKGHSEEWLKGRKAMRERMKAILESGQNTWPIPKADA